MKKLLDEPDYEGEMVKHTLKKLIVFSQELLPMIKDDEQMPAWLQDKFSKLDYYINAVYSYIKFSELDSLSMEKPQAQPELPLDEFPDLSEMALEVLVEDKVNK